MADNDNTIESEKTFTQDEVNRMMGELRRTEREKHADYDTLKEKAAQFDALQEASKSELEKALEAANTANAELDKLRKQVAHDTLVRKIADEKGVPASLLKGNDEESIRTSADSLLNWQKTRTPNIPADTGGAATPPSVTKEQIEAIKDPLERVRQRAANQSLYQ